jgi:exodeoxyribonuclease VII large subunit
MAPVQDDLFASSTPQAFTVSELAARARRLLEESFPIVRVVGELTDLSRAPSGHAYFSLKDQAAVFPAVMFRPAVARIGGALPPPGTAVECLGRLTLYEPRGRTQLVVEWLVPQGAGLLSIRLLQLRAKLQAEGLFDPARKRRLPRFPAAIGVVTSPHGAAVHDILKVLSWRFPSIPVLIAPVRVQGEGAAAQIAAALARLGNGGRVEVVILARGGGSSEDLSAFNDEGVVRAVAACAVPVVSAIGHELDVVLSDMAADLRAPTPTAAAELVVPDRREVGRHLQVLIERSGRLLHWRLESSRNRLGGAGARIRDPRLVLAAHRIRLDEVRARAQASLDQRSRGGREALVRLRLGLAAADPRAAVRERRAWLGETAARLPRGMRLLLERRRSVLGTRRTGLASLSPLAVLSRGYAVVFGSRGQALKDAGQVAVGERIRVRLRRGSLGGRVESIEDPEDE